MSGIHLMFLGQSQQGDPVEVNYVASGADTADGVSSYTFNSVNIGSANDTRQVFVLTNLQDSRSITSATIGGVSATILPGDQGSTASRAGFFAQVPTGTTANIVFTTDATGNYCLYSVYSVINRVSTSTSTDFESRAYLGSGPINSTIIVPSNGFFIGVYGSLSDQVFTSSPATLDNYNTSGSADGVYQSAVSYTGPGGSITNTYDWPSGFFGVGLGLWAFAR